MKENDKAIYIKIPGKLRDHVNGYVSEKKVKGGLSGLIKTFLIRRTKFKDS